MLGTPCSVYRGSMSSCLKPWGGTATSGSDICRWYGGRPSRGRLLLLLLLVALLLLLLLPPALGGWGRNWGRPWLSDGGKGRHGSDICLWNLREGGS